MSRSRTLLRRLAALTIVPLLGISLATTAQAAQGDCGDGYTCMWENKDFGGGAVSFQRYIPDLSQWSMTNGNRANDTISSVKNRGNVNGTCLFANANGTGSSRHVSRRQQIQDLGSYGFNDTISSAYFDGFLSC